MHIQRIFKHLLTTDRQVRRRFPTSTLAAVERAIRDGEVAHDGEGRVAIDQLGTLHDAIAEAKKLAGLSSADEVRIEVLPEPTNFFESLFGDLDAEKETKLTAGLNRVAPELMTLARRAARLRSIFDRPVAFMMPFDLEIK